MTVTIEPDLMTLVGKRNMAVRHNHPPAETAELDRQITAIQVRRDLGRLAAKASGLPSEMRRELSVFLAEQLGVAA